MLVFSTRLPIRAEVTQQECLELFLEWLNGSPYYPTDEICFDVNSHDDYAYTKGAVSKWLKHAMRGSTFFRNIFGQVKTECRKNGTQGIIFIRNSKWNEL